MVNSEFKRAGDEAEQEVRSGLIILDDLVQSGLCWLSKGCGPDAYRFTKKRDEENKRWSTLCVQLSALAHADPELCLELGRRWISSLPLASELKCRGPALGWEAGHVAITIANWQQSVDAEVLWYPAWRMESFHTVEKDDEGGYHRELHSELVGGHTLINREDETVWTGFSVLSDSYRAQSADGADSLSAEDLMPELIEAWGGWMASDYEESSQLVMILLAYKEELTLKSQGPTVSEGLKVVGFKRHSGRI